MRFTDAAIRGLKPSAERFEAFEDNGRGFGLRVAPTGRKTWFTLYRFNGTPRRLTHGTFPAVTLAEARRKHADALAQVEKGTDPGRVKVAASRANSAAMTFPELVDEYERVEASKLKAGTELVRLIRKDAVPEWQHRKAGNVMRRDVVLLVDKVRERSASTAEHLQGRLVRLFNFAAERGILDTSPIVGLRQRSATKPRERTLTDEEIRTFWKATGDTTKLEMTPATADALRLILLTGQRPGEVSGAPCDEFDGDLWTIPASRYKTERAHVTPLPPLAAQIVKDRTGGDDKYLFPSPRNDGPIRVRTLAKAVRRNREALGFDTPATPHDLRRTVRTRLASLGVNPVVAEKVIGHTLPGMMKVYDRHEYLDEKRVALELWETELRSIVRGSK